MALVRWYPTFKGRTSLIDATAEHYRTWGWRGPIDGQPFQFKCFIEMEGCPSMMSREALSFHRQNAWPELIACARWVPSEYTRMLETHGYRFRVAFNGNPPELCDNDDDDPHSHDLKDDPYLSNERQVPIDDADLPESCSLLLVIGNNVVFESERFHATSRRGVMRFFSAYVPTPQHLFFRAFEDTEVYLVFWAKKGARPSATDPVLRMNMQCECVTGGKTMDWWTDRGRYTREMRSRHKRSDVRSMDIEFFCATGDTAFPFVPTAFYLPLVEGRSPCFHQINTNDAIENAKHIFEQTEITRPRIAFPMKGKTPHHMVRDRLLRLDEPLGIVSKTKEDRLDKSKQIGLDDRIPTRELAEFLRRSGFLRPLTIPNSS